MDYKKPECAIAFSMMRHGIKQVLADCVAGAGKRGDTVQMQVTTMTEVWNALKTGVRKERANAKAPKLTPEQIASAIAQVPGMTPEMQAMMQSILAALTR